MALFLFPCSATVTIHITDPESIPLWAVTYRNVSFMEHTPSHSCIDSVFSLNDSRFGSVHFFAGSIVGLHFHLDNHFFSISDDGSVCAEVSLDYETQSVFSMSVVCRLGSTFASLLLPFQVTVIDISFHPSLSGFLNAT